jgi:hypothetical protein
VVGGFPGNLSVLGEALRQDFFTSDLLTSKYHVRNVPKHAGTSYWWLEEVNAYPRDRHS